MFLLVAYEVFCASNHTRILNTLGDGVVSHRLDQECFGSCETSSPNVRKALMKPIRMGRLSPNTYFNGLCNTHTSQVWKGQSCTVKSKTLIIESLTGVGAEAFPVASTFRASSERAGNWSELNCHSLSFVFTSHRITSSCPTN